MNETHPERNSDVVFFLDTFAEARRGELGTLDLGVRAAASLADSLPAREGPGRPRLVRRRPELADRDLGDDAALPHRRLAARRRDPAQLRLEGPGRDSAADAAAAGARARAQPAARRAGGRRADRPARARLRSRSDRAVALLVRARGRERDRAARVPALATPAGGSAHEVRARSEFRSSSGARGCRWKPSWRRCGHSGATPESCACSDGCRRARGCGGPRGLSGRAGHPPAAGRAWAGGDRRLRPGVRAPDRWSAPIGFGLVALGGDVRRAVRGRGRAPRPARAGRTRPACCSWPSSRSGRSRAGFLRGPIPTLAIWRLGGWRSACAVAAVLGAIVVADAAAASGGGGIVLETVGVAAAIGALVLVTVLLRRHAQEL